MDDLNRLFYGDDVPWSERSTWYKVKFSVERYASRIRDAWLVLTGRAFIE
jgi:hypothetical protein